MNRFSGQMIACVAVLVSAPANAVAPMMAPISDYTSTSSSTFYGSTRVSMRTLSELTSRDTKRGQKFNLEVTEDVIEEGQVVIPAGSRAVGEVTNVIPKRTWGKPGKIEARILYAIAGDRQIAITGDLVHQGESRKKQVIRASLLIAPIVGFWMKGRDAVLPAYSAAVGFMSINPNVSLASASMSLRPAPTRTDGSR